MIRNQAVMLGFPHSKAIWSLHQAMTNKAGVIPKFSLASPATKDGSGSQRLLMSTKKQKDRWDGWDGWDGWNGCIMLYL